MFVTQRLRQRSRSRDREVFVVCSACVVSDQSMFSVSQGASHESQRGSSVSVRNTFSVDNTNKDKILLDHIRELADTQRRCEDAIRQRDNAYRLERRYLSRFTLVREI